MSNAAIDVHDPATLPLIEGKHTYGSLTDRIAGAPLERFRRRWLIGVAVTTLLTLVGLCAATYLILRGVGVWGIAIPVAWGFAIVNFVWWIGIGHAGTLISAILLLLRQPWRNSINRFAEAMTLFAVMQAGLFPLLHLGRIWKFFYILPYPNQMRVWPQWRSPLVWDAFAVATYFTVSVLFWYLGLVPDLASLRDTARRGWVRKLAHVFALGWRGSTAHWERLQLGYLLLGGLATPLVVSVHSIVSLDFAVSIVPGWNPTIFPPYFVAGAIYSGFAMVLTLAIPLRAAFGFQDIVTTRHLDLMAKVMLTTGLIVGYGYVLEMFTECLSGDPAERYRLFSRFLGHGGWSFITTIVCNIVIGQLLWFKRVRMTPWMLFLVALVINVGMWMERFDIVVISLERDFLPSSWGVYFPTYIDWAVLIGTLGFFSLLFLLFLRIVPISPIYEIKELAHKHKKITHDLHEEPAELIAATDAPLYALVGEFDTPEMLTKAARHMRESGYTQLEAYTPMPVKGLFKALRGHHFKSRIAPATLIGGITGGCAAYLLLSLTAVVIYPWIAGGKPYHAWPSFIPITFEMTVLGASFGAFFGVLITCRLPRLSHPIFATPSFRRVTRDRFFLAVERTDARFDRTATAQTLQTLGALRVLETPEERT